MAKKAKEKTALTPEREFNALSDADKVLYMSAYVLDEASKGNLDLARAFYDNMQSDDAVANKGDDYIKILTSQMGLIIATGHLISGPGEVDGEDHARREALTIGMHIASYIAHLESRLRILETKLKETTNGITK